MKMILNIIILLIILPSAVYAEDVVEQYEPDKTILEFKSPQQRLQRIKTTLRQEELSSNGIDYLRANAIVFKHFQSLVSEIGLVAVRKKDQSSKSESISLIDSHTGKSIIEIQISENYQFTFTRNTGSNSVQLDLATEFKYVVDAFGGQQESSFRYNSDVDYFFDDVNKKVKKALSTWVLADAKAELELAERDESLIPKSSKLKKILSLGLVTITASMLTTTFIDGVTYLDAALPSVGIYFLLVLRYMRSEASVQSQKSRLVLMRKALQSGTDLQKHFKPSKEYALLKSAFSIARERFQLEVNRIEGSQYCHRLFK